MKLFRRIEIMKVFSICLATILLVVCALSQASAQSTINELIKKAEQGDANAQYKLAVMYFKGEGVSQNYTFSYAWFKLAAAQGDEDARINSEQVAPLLSTEELAEAHKLIAEIQEQIAVQAVDDTPPQLAETDDSDLIWGTPFQFAIWHPVQLFPKNWNVYGLRTNIFYGKNQDIYGLDIGLLANRADHVTGIQVAGAINRVSGNIRGIQLVGFANNVFNADITGIQIGFGNAAKNLTGIQLGCCAEATDSSIGIQCGAIFTKTNTLKGLQFGFVNITDQGIGLQLGIGNISTGMSGLQIGLINIMENGFLPVFPIINFSMSTKDDAPEADK